MPHDTYFMPRSEAEAQRLDEQGLIFETALDYQIHPDIEATLPADPVIADIGTGTGDYLIRLSEQYSPRSTFYGFDMSSSMYPAEADLPENVHLNIQDIREPFPDEYHNKFDFVHLRLLVGGMDKDDWALATKNVLPILKPGGAIQWEEADFITGRRLRGGRAGASSKWFQYAMQPMASGNSFRYKYGYCTLPGVFEEAGLEKVVQDIVSSDRVLENRERAGRLALKAVFTWAQKKRDQGDLTDLWPGYEQEEVERRAYEDVKNGAYSRYDIYNTIAFKPRQ